MDLVAPASVGRWTTNGFVQKNRPEVLPQGRASLPTRPSDRRGGSVADSLRHRRAAGVLPQCNLALFEEIEEFVTRIPDSLDCECLVGGSDPGRSRGRGRERGRISKTDG